MPALALWMGIVRSALVGSGVTSSVALRGGALSDRGASRPVASDGEAQDLRPRSNNAQTEAWHVEVEAFTTR
jgi:hypothetical protein